MNDKQLKAAILDFIVTMLVSVFVFSVGAAMAMTEEEIHEFVGGLFG